ncbi:helix-turn-helix domain-containing protein [Vulcanisaeta thermophila]|uniref:helix-turn-helix domain-containing protein n=1 Tax=Vulcanisaeta thermophila TaxID=867917 RepID=UPI0008529CA0|nr:helix-turn-helix domain-containing protein [Vulcanisaeta thermophila]
MKGNVVRLYVRLHHYNDWTEATADYPSIETNMIYYYPFFDKGYSIEGIVVRSMKHDELKTFLRRLPHLGNIVDVVHINKINNHLYEVLFLGDIRGMVKYAILNEGGIVVSSKVKEGTKDFTVYLINDNKERISSLYEKLNNYGKLLDFTVNKIPRSIPLFNHGTTPHLTNIERRILVYAYLNGYFDSPRNVNLSDIAMKFGVSKSTANAHLRKAVKKILNVYLVRDLVGSTDLEK